MTTSSSITPTVLMEGLALGESPRWHDGRLWLSDWLAGQVLTVDYQGRHFVQLEMSGLPFCFDWLPDGRMLILSNGDGRKLLRREFSTRLHTVADLSTLSPHPWNEIVVADNGNAYVNSIGFDMMGGAEPQPGIIAVVAPDGSARQVAGDLRFPNGMVITPDGGTLIVSESYAQCLTAFDIEPDGGLSNRRVWAEVDGHPDGICIDAEGAIWCAAMTRCVRVREGGQILAEVPLDRAAFACMLGGPQSSTLYVMVAEWAGSEGMSPDRRTGQILTAPAPAPRAGHP
ncbi:SMP-30/gluconolactonase/LRE family protein [Nocardia sp. NPDC005978]|uniref:SMP-30/gluconolactonase/LRE family protein n=1 Tax=unclassified Nocardia TaxID=2637762 RepID=UPI0033BCFBCC